MAKLPKDTKSLIGKEIFETLRSDESQTPVKEYGRVQSITDIPVNGWFKINCTKVVTVVSHIQLRCLIQKGVYHGAKIYLNVK